MSALKGLTEELAIEKEHHRENYFVVEPYNLEYLHAEVEEQAQQERSQHGQEEVRIV